MSAAVKPNRFEIVMLLEQGPDERGRYEFTLFWVDATGKRRAQVYNADPYSQISGRSGRIVRIKDATGNWKGKDTYP